MISELAQGVIIVAFSEGKKVAQEIQFSALIPYYSKDKSFLYLVINLYAHKQPLMRWHKFCYNLSRLLVCWNFALSLAFPFN